MHTGRSQLEYLAVYGRASMGVPVGEQQYSTVLDGHVRPWRTVIGRRLGLQHNFFCHGQKRDYLSHVSQRARGATKN